VFELGDEVILLGSEADGRTAITAEELAKTAGMLSYEITCGIGQRVPRIPMGTE
jgi:alanine racemase